MFTSKNRDDLEEKGYTILENAVQDHAHLKQEFDDWREASFGRGNAPYSVHSIVRQYAVGHLEPAWKTRLQVKPLFAQLWGTDQLLTSFDAVAIGQPAELGNEEFDSETNHWLHTDQGAARKGLHAYQGAVYLETADEDDWTFEVLEGSHLEIEAFYKQNLKATLRSADPDFWRIADDDLDFFTNRGCKRKRIAVPAGGLLLWDSRLIHANARPVKGRKHPGRWRLVVMVCMTPARWAKRQDLETKRKAYKEMLLTTHWPSEGVCLMDSRLPSYAPKDRAPKDRCLPEVAKTLKAKQLAGVAPYSTKKSDKVTLYLPKWDVGLRPSAAVEEKWIDQSGSRVLLVAVVCGLLALLYSFVYR